MNIAFVNKNKLNPRDGGVERITKELSIRFESRGYNVFFFYYNGEKPSNDNEIQIPYYYNKYEVGDYLTKIINTKHIDIIIDQDGDKYLFSHKYIHSDVKLLKCYHTCTKDYNLIPSLFSGFWKRPNKEKFLQLCFFINTPIRFLKRRHYFRDVIKNRERLILLDEKYILKGLDKNKCSVIVNGIDLKKNNSSINKKEKIILFVGRLFQSPKNLLLMLKLWKQLSKKHNEWKFVICGDGPDRYLIDNFIKKHGLERIELIGNTDPFEYYKKASIFLLPSFFEGFPMVLLEAMKYGCVPIVFDTIPAHHKLCNNEMLSYDSPNKQCGILVPELNSSKYIEECDNLMSHNELLNTLSYNSLINIRNYDIEKICDDWEQLFHDLIDN